MCIRDSLWPVASLITAIGLGVGTGGSVVMANALGAHDGARALRVRGTTLICLALASAVLTLGLSFGYPYALRALGASGELWQPSVDYLRLVCLFCTAQVLSLIHICAASGSAIRRAARFQLRIRRGRGAGRAVRQAGAGL